LRRAGRETRIGSEMPIMGILMPIMGKMQWCCARITAIHKRGGLGGEADRRVIRLTIRMGGDSKQWPRAKPEASRRYPHMSRIWLRLSDSNQPTADYLSAKAMSLKPSANLYERYRCPPAIIRHAVWLYYRCNLSHRDIEDLLAERGIEELRIRSTVVQQIRSVVFETAQAQTPRVRRHVFH